MILLNFGHPLTPSHRSRIEELADDAIDEVREFKPQFDNEQSFAEQAQSLADGVGLSTEAWQTEHLLINPPTHSVIAVTLLAELHGRMGYFPAVIRLKPVLNSVPPTFEVAEIVNLQAVRDAARVRR